MRSPRNAVATAAAAVTLAGTACSDGPVAPEGPTQALVEVNTERVTLEETEILGRPAWEGTLELTIKNSTNLPVWTSTVGFRLERRMGDGPWESVGRELSLALDHESIQLEPGESVEHSQPLYAYQPEAWNVTTIEKSEIEAAVYRFRLNQADWMVDGKPLWDDRDEYEIASRLERKHGDRFTSEPFEVLVEERN